MTGACFACRFEGRDFPCRRDGAYDATQVAAAYLAHVLRAANDAEAVEHWSYDCLASRIETAPAEALATIEALLSRLETPQEASLLAAGPLEDLIADNGAAVIGRIETLARNSPRFRFLLSGVWPQGGSDSPVWARVLAARAPGPAMDDGGALPKD